MEGSPRKKRKTKLVDMRANTHTHTQVVPSNCAIITVSSSTCRQFYGSVDHRFRNGPCRGHNIIIHAGWAIPQQLRICPGASPVICVTKLLSFLLSSLATSEYREPSAINVSTKYWIFCCFFFWLSFSKFYILCSQIWWLTRQGLNRVDAAHTLNSFYLLAMF